MKRILLLILAIFAASAFAQMPTRLNKVTGEPTAKSWRVDDFGGAATIPNDTYGFGWDELGRFTIQTPVGAFQIYSTGSPAVPTLYWPGTIVTNRNESLATTTALPASNITAGAGIEGINQTVVDNTLREPLLSWQGFEVRAGASGIPFVADLQGVGGSNEATDGVYWAQVIVTGQVASTSSMRGRYRTPEQALSDLGRVTATAALDFPSIAAGAQADLTITLTGAVVGDSLSLGLPASPASGLVFNLFVSAANTVTIRASNISSAPVDAASATYRVTKF